MGPSKAGPVNTVTRQSALARALPKLRPAIAIVIAAASALTGCATPETNSRLERIPHRVIDRFLTLPSGAVVWKTFVSGEFDRAAGYDPVSRTYVTPLIWEQGLSDSVTLVWTPFPTDARFSLGSVRQWDLSLNAFLMGRDFAKYKYFVWKPGVSLLARRKLSEDTALELDLAFDPELGHAQTTSLVFFAGLSPSVWVQITDALAWNAGLTVGLEQGSARARFTSDYQLLSDAALALRLPVSSTLSLRASRAWEVTLRYRLYALGYSNGYQSHEAFAAVLHYW